MYAFFAFCAKNRAFTPFRHGSDILNKAQKFDIRYTKRSDFGTFFLTSERFRNKSLRKMSVKFFLANPQSEKSSIDVIVRFRGRRFKKGIGVSIVTAYWDPNRQLSVVNQKYRAGVIANHKIKEWKLAIERLIFRAETENLTFMDADHFWSFVQCEREGVPYENLSTRTSYFCDYFQAVFIPRFVGNKQPSRITRFRATLSALTEYEKSIGMKLRFVDINQSFYRDFESWCYRSKNYTPNYFGTLIKVVKQVMREAMDFDKLHTCSEFLRFKVVKTEVDTVYLTVEELRKIHRLEIDDTFIEAMYPGRTFRNAASIRHSAAISKNLFLIGAFTGLRVSDFSALRESNIQDGKITVITTKDRDRVIIPLHPIIKEILDSGFDLSETLSEQKIGIYIRDICRYVGIDDPIETREYEQGNIVVKNYRKWQKVSTHTARRSFATNAYKSGIPTLAIMKITGHSKEADFMNYIRISKEENAEMLANRFLFKE